MSAERGERLSLLAVHRQTIILEQAAKRAHERIDEIKEQYPKDLAALQAAVSKDLGSIQKGIEIINVGLQDLRDWKNRALGWAAAAVFLASVLGAAVATAIVRYVLTPSPAEHTMGPPRKPVSFHVQGCAGGGQSPAPEMSSEPAAAGPSCLI